MKIQILKERIDVSKYFVPTDGNTLDHFLNKFNKNIEDLKQKYLTQDVVSHRLWVERFGYDGGFFIELYTYRLETDEEEQKRLETERIKQEKAERTRLKKLENKRIKQSAKEEAERIEYERLKAKYGE